MRRPARPARTPLRALAPFVAAGILALAASATVGLEPGEPIAIAESAFERVTFGSPAPEASARPERTPDLQPMRDPALFDPIDPPDRARPDVPDAKPIVRIIPKPEPKTTHAITGLASWYCRAGISPCTSGIPDGSGFNAYAAAGPKLRAALGADWRGRVILVDGIRVKLIDWCQCYQGEPHEKLLDLYYDVYKRTGTNVRIRW